ncbi:MAG: LON peptidase substrate-binding domain-containing protein [Rubrivivax sp.]
MLFPGARLALRVFEARYLDLVSDCMRRGVPFGVVCLKRGSDTARVPGQVAFEAVGVAARIDGRCRGRRHPAPALRGLALPATQGGAWRRESNLWLAAAESIPDDPPRQPGPAMLQTVNALAEAVLAPAARQGAVLEPYRLDDAGWVAQPLVHDLAVPLAAKRRWNWPIR